MQWQFCTRNYKVKKKNTLKSFFENTEYISQLLQQNECSQVFQFSWNYKETTISICPIYYELSPNSFLAYKYLKIKNKWNTFLSSFPVSWKILLYTNQLINWPTAIKSCKLFSVCLQNYPHVVKFHHLQTRQPKRTQPRFNFRNIWVKKLGLKWYLQLFVVSY